MTPRSATAIDTARGLWTRIAGDVTGPAATISAAHGVCAQLQTGLARWVGADGYRALLHRALELARAEHSVLKLLSCNGSDEQEIAAAVQAQGAAEVVAGMVTLVATVIDLLGRIIGEEMAVELVTQAIRATPRTASNSGTEGARNG